MTSCVLALSLLAPGAQWRGATSCLPLCGSIQVAKSTKLSDSDDRGGAEESWSRSSAVRVRGRVKFHPNGYDAGRVRRFWRHYHGARTQEKTKRPQVAR